MKERFDMIAGAITIALDVTPAERILRLHLTSLEESGERDKLNRLLTSGVAGLRGWFTKTKTGLVKPPPAT